MKPLSKLALVTALSALSMLLTDVKAQTKPAAFNPAALDDALQTADTAQAAALLSKVTPEQVPAFIALFDPTRLRLDTHDAIMQSVGDLVRRARAARKSAHEAEEQEWDLRTGLAVYKATGPHDPAWDALAVDALSSNAENVSDSAKKYRAAVDAGCTDPLVRYYNIRRGLVVKTVTPAAVLAQYVALLPDIDKSPYSPVRKMQVHVQILRLCLDDLARNRPLAQQSWNDIVKLLPQIVAEKPSHLIRNDTIVLLDSSGKKLGHSLKTDFDKIYPSLSALFPDDAYPYAYAADFYTNWAWEARGGGWANSVTEDGWKLFGQRLELAEQAATTGATLDPLNGPCPASMITICMGLSHDRAVMEKWFTRAMLADPNNVQACRAKYYYLLPKWGGSVEEVVQFGRECLNFGTVESRIPVILIDIHGQLAQDSGDPQRYLAQAAVWTDIDAVYKKLLSSPQRQTTDHAEWLFDRAKYVSYAYECHQWQAVIDLANQFKDDLDVQVFGGKAVYNFYKKKAEQSIAKAPI